MVLAALLFARMRGSGRYQLVGCFRAGREWKRRRPGKSVGRERRKRFFEAGIEKSSGGETRREREAGCRQAKERRDGKSLDGKARPGNRVRLRFA